MIKRGVDPMHLRKFQRFLIILSVICLFAATASADLDIVYKGNDTAVYGAVTDTGGYIINVVPPSLTVSEQVQYSLTPLDVVIVIDHSGSMSLAAGSGKSLLGFSTEAAEKFVNVLMAVNPSSRVGLVAYSDSAEDVVPLTGLNDQAVIIRGLNSLSYAGKTNQTDGFEHATAMLRGRRPEAKGMVLLLTDGIYNVGGHPGNAGYAAAENNLVYTVGLVGNLDESERNYVRDALACGYETRYFEVNFRDMNDAELNNLAADFMTMAIAASYGRNMEGTISLDLDDSACCYLLRVDGSMDVRVVAENSRDYLSSAIEDYCDSAEFGSIAVGGSGMDEKIVVLRPGHYGISLRGNRTGRGSYSLTSISGLTAEKKVICSESVDTWPSGILYFDVRDGKAARTDLNWEPLDHKAVDPFTGQITRGSQAASASQVNGTVSPAAWVSEGAPIGESLKKNTPVQVLARDGETEMRLISYVNEDKKLCRGWVKARDVKETGFVPELIRDEPIIYTLPGGVQTRRAPSRFAAEADKIKTDTRATLIHAEYDVEGNEWAYLLLDGGKKRSAVYVLTSEIPGWTPVSPKGFRIGYLTPTFVWDEELGKNGYTEVMWTASKWDGNGVAVSGRTSSKSGTIKAANGDRDALALLLSPDGTMEKSVTYGGSELDSFHCILPAEDGFYVSGVTRSNDKDFAGIWDSELYSGKTGKTHKRTNALIGKLKPDMSIDWMKSFGVGNKSFGFDMVIATADNKIAGCGWLTTNKSFALTGNGAQDFLLMKLTPDGRVTDYNCFGGGDEDVPDSAVATEDGGIIHVGKVGKKGNGTGKIWFANEALHAVSSVSYGGSQDCLFDNIRDLENGTYLVTGYTAGYGHGGLDFWALRIDGQGRVLWQRTYGGSEDEELRGTAILNDGTAVLVGDTLSRDGDVLGATGKGKNAWAIGIDQNGRILWQYTAFVSGDNWFNDAAEDPADGSIVLGGTCAYKNDKSAKGYLVKVQVPRPMIPEEVNP